VGLVTQDVVRREMQGGLALDFAGMTVTGDLLYANKGLRTGGSHLLPLFGMEKALGRNLFVRLGANPDDFAGGLGFWRGRLGLDYGVVFHRSLREDNFGSHQVQMTYRFGRRVAP
jgi:hypothetical protein